MAAPSLGQAPLWYLTRSTGLTSFVLLTAATAFGVAATQRRLAHPSWPRFATQQLHRNVSLLALLFLAVHVSTTILDGYVDISWWSVVVPGASAYRTLWVALGTVASDLLLLVVATSLLRLRMTYRAWQRVHLTSYALWPLTWLHFLKTGTDAGGFGFALGIGCAGVVGAAVAFRLMTDHTPTPVASVR
jgi:predicted ferric reductase